MQLQDIVAKNLALTSTQIKADPQLAAQIQNRLTALHFLEPPADGKFGMQSISALADFNAHLKLATNSLLTKVGAEALIETKELIPLKLGTDLASRIVKHCIAKNYFLARGSKRYSIIYIEGLNPDGTPNSDTPNTFNDIRCVLEIPDGTPRLVFGPVLATTEPGKFWTQNPMNAGGAARIKFGQYIGGWVIGSHGNGKSAHRSLVQCGPIEVHRDLNKDYKRTGDRIDRGLFGVNQHHSYGQAQDNVGRASAGCLVGWNIDSHFKFMDTLQQDRRYLISKSYQFGTIVLPGDELVK